MKRKPCAVVTGCGSGMGRKTARYLAVKGYQVVALTRDMHTFGEPEEGVVPVEVDLTDIESITRAVSALDRVDVLVNNAGYGYVSSVEEADEAQMIAQFDVNVFGVLRMCKAVTPLMRRNGGGVIVNISSFLGKMGLPLLTFYNATKYAVEGITDSLRHELRPFGIRVHAVLPGFFATEFARKHLVVNEAIDDKASPYAPLVERLVPRIVSEINGGNDAEEVARAVWSIIQDPASAPRVSVGDKAAKFLPMRRELDDEAFEMRVRRYYGLE